ncbi:MAG: MFS transporter [Chloroflexi bacterium]|nr:MFS transporter [Chloroflexota bacterium]
MSADNASPGTAAATAATSQAPAPPSASLRPWAPFAHRDFTWLWLGGVSATVTMLLRTLISAQWLYDETGSAAQLGIMSAIQFAQMPVVIYGGALADNFDRKKLMAMTQLVAFLALLAVTLLAAAGSLRPWHIFAVTGVSGIVNMLGNSARPAMVSRVVPRSLIGNAVATNTATWQVAGVIAPLAFAVFYEAFGVTTAFAVATGIAASSMVAPFLIRVSGEPDGGPRRTTWKSITEGYSFVRTHRILPGLYLLDIGVTVVSFYRTLFPIFADQLYGMGAAAVGPLNAANSIGGVAGSFIVYGTNRIARKGLLVLAFSLGYALLLFAFGFNRALPDDPVYSWRLVLFDFRFNTPFLLGLLIVFGLGMTDAVSMVMRQTIVQLTTPDKLLGRASSAHSFAAMGANNLGGVEVAFLSGAIGAGPTMVIGGAVSVAVVFLIGWGVRGIRRYRYDPARPYEAYEGGAPPVTS